MRNRRMRRGCNGLNLSGPDRQGTGGQRSARAAVRRHWHRDLSIDPFEWKYAIAGIIANLHDVVIILGFFALFQWEFSLSVLAAVLAVLGYSVNESVVIFDRIRETFRKNKKMTV